MFGFGVSMSHEIFIMQSEYNKEKIIKYLENNYCNFNNSKDLLKSALDESGQLSKNDFVDSDWRDILVILKNLYI